MRSDRLLGLSARAIVVIAALEALWLVYLGWITFVDPLGDGGFPFRYQFGTLISTWADPAIAVLVIGWFVDGVIASGVIRAPRGRV